jgi:hypothetical protein
MKHPRRHGWVGIGLCSTLVVLPAALAAAQAPGPMIEAPRPPAAVSGKPPAPLAKALTGQAAADYQAARVLFDDGDYAGASLKFQHALAESGDARLLWNVAVCEKNLRHYAAVLGLVERYAHEVGANMTPEHRAEVDDVLNTVRTLVSTVHLNVDQPGAAIHVDGEPAGTTPLTQPLLIDLGRHSIAITLAGFEEHVISQDFGGGTYSLFEVNLRREDTRGKLHVIADAAASIRVDGNLMGQGEWQGSLPAGQHGLRVSADGMRDYTKDVSVSAGKENTLYVTLEASESEIPSWVWIGAGVVVAGGLATGGYFLFRGPEKVAGLTGTLDSVDLKP